MLRRGDMRPGRSAGVLPANRPVPPRDETLARSAPTSAPSNDRPSQLLSERARSFSFAARFLPPAQRQATETLYQFCRLVDDLVDEPTIGWTPAKARAQLDAWTCWLHHGALAGSTSALHDRLGDVIRAYAIPPRCLVQLVEGQTWDLELRPVRTTRDLEAYCYRVGATVGVAMAHILGAADPVALRRAAQLGMAMQLTNILRDVDEDLDRGRVYLPSRELGRHRDARDGLLARTATPGLTVVVRSLARLARHYYVEGRLGITLLPPSSQLAILLAATLYERILDKIEARGYDVFAGRASTTTTEKVLAAIGAVIGQRRLRNGSAV